MKKDKKMNEQTLGGRLKGYEAQYESEIEPEKHIILRIDGHHFSKYTKGLNKPFDRLLSYVMIETTKDLVERFGAYTGYTQSDEITLFLPSLKDITVDDRKKPTHKIHKRVRDEWTHIMNGRVQKIVSLVAAFTTMSFNKHFQDELYELSVHMSPSAQEYISKVNGKSGLAYFDCRIYGVPDKDEVFNSFMWRVRDAEKIVEVCLHKHIVPIKSFRKRLERNK